MTRFQLLALLERYPSMRSVEDVAAIAARHGYYRKTLREAIRIQLKKMVRYRLISCYWKPFRWNGRNYGSYVYRIRNKGRERLEWARNQGLI